MSRLILCIAFVLAGFEVSAQTYSISGTFKLPAGVVAPSGGTEFKLSTDPLESFAVGGGTLETSASVVIAPFGNMSSYSLPLRDASSSSFDPNPKKIRFSCVSGCDGLGVVISGYWSTTVGVVDVSGATEFPAIENATVNIELPKGDVFSGVIKLPDEFIANGDETIVITAKAASFGNAPEFSESVQVESGDTEWPFLISVPQLVGVGSWFIRLTCADCDENIPAQIHYPTTVAGDPLSLSPSERFFFIKSRNYNDMTLTFISTKEPVPETKASMIVGSIFLLLMEEE